MKIDSKFKSIMKTLMNMNKLFIIPTIELKLPYKKLIINIASSNFFLEIEKQLITDFKSVYLNI